jgi:hypothetical protein
VRSRLRLAEPSPRLSWARFGHAGGRRRARRPAENEHDYSAVRFRNLWFAIANFLEAPAYSESTNRCQIIVDPKNIDLINLYCTLGLGSSHCD